jgi:hypothetical protein
MVGITANAAKRHRDTTARLIAIEQWIAEGQSYSSVVRKVAERFGVRARQAERYVEACYKRWLAESRAEDRAAARERLREQALHVYRTALGRTRAVPVLEGEGVQRLEHVPDPDLASANKALDLLGRLDGVIFKPADAPRVQINTLVGDNAIANLRAFFLGSAEPEPAPAPALPAVIDTEAKP